MQSAGKILSECNSSTVATRPYKAAGHGSDYPPAFQPVSRLLTGRENFFVFVRLDKAHGPQYPNRAIKLTTSGVAHRETAKWRPCSWGGANLPGRGRRDAG